MVDVDLLLSLPSDTPPRPPRPPLPPTLDQPILNLDSHQSSSLELTAPRSGIMFSNSVPENHKKRSREEDEEGGEYDAQEKRPRLDNIGALHPSGIYHPDPELDFVHHSTAGDLPAFPSPSTSIDTTLPAPTTLPFEGAQLLAAPPSPDGGAKTGSQVASSNVASPYEELGFQLPPKPKPKKKNNRSRNRSRKNDSLGIFDPPVGPTSKLRMDQITASPVAKSSGTPPSTDKWDHSKFKDSSSNLAYRAFKDIRSTVPPQPRLPPAPKRNGSTVPGVQTISHATFNPRTNAPTAPRSHTAPSSISLPFKPDLTMAWHTRSLPPRPQIQSTSTSIQKQHNELKSSIPPTATPSIRPSITNPPSRHDAKANLSDSIRVKELETQVQSLTDRLAFCETELRETKVKLDFANMTAGRAGANLGNARKEIKELKERIKMLESGKPTAV